jgi:hypothetical protein
VKHLFRRRPTPPPPDPMEFFARLMRAKLGEGYGAMERYKDFRAVFMGQSDAAQGNRVLWQIFEWARLYGRVATPGDPHETYFRDGERNIALRILAALTSEPPVE